ncbi:MAG: DUF4876 domain-containing protein [Bacteroidales bacterium]
MRRFLSIALLMGAVSFTSCDDPIEVAKTSTVTVNLSLPSYIVDGEISESTVVLTEKNSGAVSTQTTTTFEIEEGTYDATFEGTVAYTENGESLTATLRGSASSISVAGETVSFPMTTFIYEEGNAGLVISEVFYTGNLTAEGSQTSDQYFKIYNNSDEVQYLDGLMIAQSAFLTTTKQDYTPDIMSTHFSTDAFISFPGNGTDYPVEPYSYVTVANDAVNYDEINPGIGFDLSGADFEIYWESLTDTDNPAVANMVNSYGLFIFHNRGFRSYALIKLDTTMDDFLANNYYDAEYIFAFGDYSFDMKTSCYKVANENILDAVNLSIEESFQWIVTDPSVDMGWTYCGYEDGDATRYGKAVVRKESGTDADGNVILLDTNNSTLDFNGHTTPTIQN